MKSALVKLLPLSGRRFHALLIVVGTAFILTNAFHGNVWFDESYSVGIAKHSFTEIWSIGSNDVHPVLFYWALHILDLIFGDNILVFRLFALSGVTCLALLGLTHLRKDFGWRTGLLFSFFVLFMPYISLESTQIRMYSWVAFMITVCSIYAFRIMRYLYQPPASNTRQTPVPLHVWLVFFTSSISSAYLHNFGVITAFVINFIVLVACLINLRKSARPLLVFLLGATLQILCYLPWLFELLEQMSVVNNQYWARYVFPTTLRELITYPIYTSFFSFANQGAYGVATELIAYLLCVSMLTLMCAFVVVALIRLVKSCRASSNPRTSLKRNFCTPLMLMAFFGITIYASVYALAWIITTFMDSYILYYRYLMVALGPLLIALAALSARLCEKFSGRVIVSASCVILLGCAALNQSLLVADSYSKLNSEPLNYFESTLKEVSSPSAEDEEQQPLVLSSDIGVQGVLAVQMPQYLQTYLNWQPGNWGHAYEAYAPSLISVANWDAALQSYEGYCLVVGQSQDGSTPRCIIDLEKRDDIEPVSLKSFYRPYEKTWFSIAVMQRKAS